MRFLVLFLSTFLILVSCEQEQVLVDQASEELELINGVLHYQNHPFNGLLVSRYDDTSYKMKLEYAKGRKDGLEQQWYANGVLSQKRWYSQGIKINSHLGWWEDGSPKFEFHFNRKGEYDGNRKEWYPNEQLVCDLNYVNGKEIGSQRMWSKTGKIRANYEVKNGERFGLIGLKKCYTVNTNSNALQ